MTVAVRAIKVDRGIKRRCGACDSPFYDLLRHPIQCPKCGAAFNADARSSAASSAKRFKASVSRTRARSAPDPEAKLEQAKRLKAKREEREANEDGGDDLILDAEDDDN
jgi:uncharacterized protein (TIGR02300 family)